MFDVERQNLSQNKILIHLEEKLNKTFQLTELKVQQNYS